MLLDPIRSEPFPRFLLFDGVVGRFSAASITTIKEVILYCGKCTDLAIFFSLIDILVEGVASALTSTRFNMKIIDRGTSSIGPVLMANGLN